MDRDQEPIPVGDSPLQFTPLINLIYMPDKKLSVMVAVLLSRLHNSQAASLDKESCAAGEANLAKIHGETGQKYMEVAKFS